MSNPYEPPAARHDDGSDQTATVRASAEAVDYTNLLITVWLCVLVLLLIFR